MREPRPIKGAKALLFERLVDESPHTPAESQPFRIYDVASLRTSVSRELMRLLNTRCPMRPDVVNGHDRTVVNYGLPDFSYMSAASGTDVQNLARLLEQAIAAFEPRLRQVRVTIDPSPKSQTAVVGTIEAMLTVGSVNEPVSFPLLLTLKSGEVEIIGA